MSGTNALFDDLGPKGQKTVRAVTILSAVGVALLLFYIVNRLYAAGQFEANLWTKLIRDDSFELFRQGLIGTLKAAGLGMVLATIVGAVMALGRLSRNRPARWLAGVYVELFRAWPLLLVLYFSFVGLPYYGIRLDAFAALIIGLTLYNGAMLAEIFRAGILSLDRGQTEAASSLGLSYRQSMMSVVLPQAGRRMLPALVSQLITLVKDSSLGAAITYGELLRTGQLVGSYSTFSGGELIPTNILQSLALVAVIFFIINFSLSRLARRLEMRQQKNLGPAALQITGGPDDLTAITVAPSK